MTIDEAERDEAHRAAMAALKEKQDAEIRSKDIERGVLIVNTGDGKGKSTAGFGLALRAAGHGIPVALVQFTKGKWKTGEGKALARLDEVEHFIVGDGFTWNTQDRKADVASARAGWELVKEKIEACRGDSPAYGLVVLDELNIVLAHEYLKTSEVVDYLRERPRDLHICITGRGAPAELIAIADTVTEMRPIKHAYEAGVKAQRGVEF